MKILAKGAVVLVVSLFALGAAQEATPQNKDGMTMGQGSMGQNSTGQNNMNQGVMGDQQGMMAMMQMMQACSNMMQTMQGKQMGMMDGQGMKPMMGAAATAAQMDKATARALARAFLTGRDSAAALTLQNVLPTAKGYTVGYVQGGTAGKLLVDAATGNVQPRTAE